MKIALTFSIFTITTIKSFFAANAKKIQSNYLKFNRPQKRTKAVIPPVLLLSKSSINITVFFVRKTASNVIPFHPQNAHLAPSDSN